MGIINIFSVLGLLVEILHLYFAPNAIFTQIGVLYTFLGIAVAYLILIYLDLYENTHINAYRLALTTLLATIAFMVNLDGINESFYRIQPIFSIIISHTPILFILYMMTVSRMIINRMKKYTNLNQAKLMNYVKYYIYFGFVGYSILQPVRNIIWASDKNEYSFTEQVWVLIIPALMLSTANLFLYLGYIKPNQPTAISPQKMDRFIIITNQGIPIYNFEFENEIPKLDETLLSGAISAITAVLKEATNIVGDLKTIEIGNQHLMLRKSDGLIGIIFTLSPTSFLDALLTELMKKIGNIYQLNKFNQLSEKSFLQITDIIRNSFGYS